jgi:ceramide glucosyltransferase
MGASAAAALYALAGVGLSVLLLQHAILRIHLRRGGAPRLPARAGAGCPAVSILKPLCGLDDELAENLASFAALDYPGYEVLLGLPAADDPAAPLAREAARRWPDRMRVVVQRYHGGRNPKVNQLVGLSREARHPVVVVSDSNVRVGQAYLRGIAEELADPRVGLVTHPVAGGGERRLGSVLENLHLAGSVGPAIVAAPRLSGRAIVVGKSMALRTADLHRLGGFEAVRDFLAEDQVLGAWVQRKLGKRVAVARQPVLNVNRERRVGEFWARYERWSVLQRKLVGGPLYATQVLLNPVLLAAAGLLASRTVEALAAFGAICVLKAALDGMSGRALRAGGFRLRHLCLVPAKDLLFGAAVLQGLWHDEVDWRGKRLRVLRGTRLAPAREDCEAAAPVGA